ncbi:hypothetical protein ASA1KI_15840 [Opitutales bacterium ASA1]|jgi:polysaccharide export outer membrane protein|uniref:polysaccharide biosynthesis/export family protein n=1 Tax=Congregicoccus parvus TaxID=3081749 RepID=UPI002B30EC66|nr:hypothetical protein ASA1KI_15840 [Opitutales bacterium ASA1]
MMQSSTLTGRRLWAGFRNALGLSALICGSACGNTTSADRRAEAPSGFVFASAAESPSAASVGGDRQTDPDYRLTSGDLIVVQMYEQDDIRTSQRLSATGEIRLPHVGRVGLLNLTVREAEMRIETLYKDGGFYVDPQIILFVQQYAERFVSVFGQVRNPARIPLAEETNSMGILQAITLSGGFTRIAREDAVQVSRTNAAGLEERFTVNVRELTSARRPGEVREFQLQAGDVVFVPERSI